MAPTLIPIDLTLRGFVRSEAGLDGGKDCDHPDINVTSYYLCKFRGGWYVGKFGLQWYGWNFNGIYSAGAQLNSSGWEEIYEVR